jgi:hypothetical protein
MKPASGSSKLNTLFGIPYKSDMALNPKWEEENIVYIDLPFEVRLDWATETRVKRIRVHKSVAKAFEQALNNVWNKARIKVKEEYGFKWQALGFATQAEATAFYDSKTRAYLRLHGLDRFGGAYNYRKMRGSSKLSFHSYGIAIDWYASKNPMGSKTTTLPDWFISCWKSAGFAWGGDWNKPDPMHFERTKPC